MSADERSNATPTSQPAASSKPQSRTSSTMPSIVSSKRLNARHLPALSLNGNGTSAHHNSYPGDATSPESFLPALISPSQIDVSDITHGAPLAASGLGLGGVGMGDPHGPLAYGPFDGGVETSTSPEMINSIGGAAKYQQHPYQHQQQWPPSGASGGLSTGSVPGIDASLSRGSDASIIAPFDDALPASSVAGIQHGFDSRSMHSPSAHSHPKSAYPKRHGSSGDLLGAKMYAADTPSHSRSTTSPSLDYSVQVRPRTPPSSASLHSQFQGAGAAAHAGPGTPNGGNSRSRSGSQSQSQYAFTPCNPQSSPALDGSHQLSSLSAGANASMASLPPQPPTPNSSLKKHKMGFGFFKKKSTKDIKDAGNDGSQGGASSIASIRATSDKQPSPGTPGTSHSLHHMGSNHSLHSSKASITGTGGGGGGGKLRGKLDSIHTAIGLDEEVLRPPGMSGSGAHGLGPAFGFSPTAASVKEKKLVKLRRPRTAEKEKERSESHESPGSLTPNMMLASRLNAWEGSDGGQKGSTIITPSQEIAGFSLDTNFDRIDDFVDISVRQRDPNADGLVGPSNETRDDVCTVSSPSAPLQRSKAISSGSLRRARSSSGTALNAAPLGRVLHQGSADQLPTLRSTVRTLSGSMPKAVGEAKQADASSGSGFGSGSGSAPVSAQPLPEQAIDVSRPGLRKMTKSQYRALIKNGSDDWSKGSLVDGDEVDEPIELALTPDACRESFHDAHLSPRKDSAASGRSDHSGVSPKSPYVQLPQLFPSLVRAGQWTAGDAPAFSFPPGGLPQGQAQGQGSSSGSASASASGLGIVKGTAPNNAKASASERLQLKASNWMAPDSWAVQPDKSRAFSMEEEQDSDDDGVVETASDPTMRRDSSSGVSSAVANDRTGRTWSSGDAGTVSSISRLHLDAQRRPTQDSVSLHSAGDEPVAASQFRPMSGSVGTLPPMARRPSDIEIVHGPTWHAPNAASTWGVQSGNGGVYSGADPIPSPTPHIRPASSRGGGSALAAASGAAVTAASKLGLRGSGGRSAKAQGRPGTAGSVQGVPLTDGSRPSGGSLGTSSVDDEQISPSASMTPATSKDSARTTRRPGTATGTSAASKPHLLRIWRKEGSFVTLSCALVSTTNDIKALLTRKSLSTDNAAYRLFVRDKGNERPLGPAEKPALIQRRRLEQAGYTDADGLEDMGREDLSYLLRFVYRPDIVPTFDSESFGNEEHMFQHLDLQGRNLEMVPIFLYKHADWIVSLDLSGNPMSDVPSDFMQMCSSLRSLRLSNLALKRLPQGIRQSQTLTHLDVSNNRIPELAHISLESCQELISVKAQNNRLFDLPPWFTRVETLRYLNLSNNRFDVFPPILCEASGLMDLDISFNSIPSLPASISKLTNLQRFIFVGNSVEELPESMSALVKLQTVDLRRNLVQDVSVLFTMPQVNVVQCEHNSIRHFEATLGTKMRSLEVGQNPLTKVSLGAYSASELTSLNLSSANMAKLEEDLFKLLPSLTELVLDRNQFVTLPDTIGELVGLVSFSCTNNNLATLPDSIGSLKKLTRANIQNNNLKVLPNSIWNCSSLQRLNVTSNLLETFPSPPLLGTDVEMGRKGSTGSHTQMPPTPVARQLPPLVRSLRKLRLGDNRLGDDVFSVLTVFLELEVLNLSFNEIYEVPSTSLACYKRLRELYLSGNSLSSVPADDLVHMQELRILHLNGNKLQTLPAELGRMRKLASLDVGNNNLKYNIANWTYDWNWNSNPELRYLNLSGNKRLEIKSKIVEVNGRRKNMSDFSRLLSLRVLGLMDVTMTLQSTPDESENRRVRTSLSQVNNMAYGIADTLGKHDNLSIVDVVVPNFRKDDSECLLGLFDGRGHDPSAGSRIARHLAEWVSFRIARELQEVERTGPDAGSVADTLRRAFLRMNKEYADALIIEGQRRTSETQTLEEKQPLSLHRTSFGPRSQWKSGASAVIAYIADRTLHIANAGDALAVMSRNGGQAELISTKHEPFDRAETERIRSAEGWVSLRGFVNDMLDVSRGFGYYHLFPVVNAAPAVTSITLSDSDEFIIIANKVLWDFLSYQTAVDIARMERDDPMIAAQRLRDLAISSGAEDSIMVMIISVSDLFFARQQRSGGALLDPSSEIFKRTQRRTREPRDLPADRTLARLEREVAPPIGQVALVFTDIKNSTSLWENNGGMQSAMRLHNTLLRRQLRTVGGYEVKTEGDAFMVSFPSVSAALLWCFNVQMQLLREDWPQEILESEDGKEVRDSNGEIVYRGLWVRMGLHWGFPVCEPDPVTRRMDYFGPMVNRASRISGAADGGQILVSKDVVNELTTLLGTFGETEEITGDVDDDEFRLLNPNVSRDVVLLRRMGFGISDMGERRLKGLETPESLFLVYPKQLAGRLEADGRTIAPAAQVFEPTVQLLDIDEVKQVGMLCLRLEALSAGHVFPGLYLDSSSQPAPTAEESDAIVTMERNTTCTNATSSSTPGIPNAIARRKAVEATLAVHPELLIYAIRDDAPDEELAGILEQLIVRISNAVAKLQLDQLSAMADLGLDMASLRAQLQAFKGGV